MGITFFEHLQQQSELKRCSGCKWWNRESRYWRKGPPELHRCNKIESTESEDWPEDLAFTTPADGCEVEFWTGPEFGCVHWEAVA